MVQENVLALRYRNEPNHSDQAYTVRVAGKSV